MRKSNSNVSVFILAKNEQQNIGRCIESLRAADWDVVVLDSGSTDETASIVSGFEFAEFRPYVYVDHCTAYNDVTSKLAVGYRYVVILDADMMVTGELQREIGALLNSGGAPQVIETEILMFADGQPLKHGSLCPPKAIVFATGQSYFVKSGHAERLRSGVTVVRTREKLCHDDRKSYAAYLQSQLRYSKNLVVRMEGKQGSFRDRVRTKTPLLILAIPFVSYIIKRGFLSGRAGALYALDRLIAEAIMYRQALSKKLGDM